MQSKAALTALQMEDKRSLNFAFKDSMFIS